MGARKSGKGGIELGSFGLHKQAVEVDAFHVQEGKKR